MDWIIYGIIIAVALVLIIVAFFAGKTYRKNIAEREIGSAEEEAKKIINDAIKSSENKKRETLIETKEEIHKERSEFDKEMKERRMETQKQERRIMQKEEQLDKKYDVLEKKEEQLAEKIEHNDKVTEEVQILKRSQLEMLEKISGFTAEEAKSNLIANLESEVRHESAIRLKELEAEYKDDADEKARDLISLAIQRCAADHVAEATVSVVPLPSDEMKGRIIGREGRNIRTLETLTGVDLIIDDTPEAITLSSFDPIRREVARISLEKLIADGRIHPARIEEMVEKARREVDVTIKQEG
ncbi:MAG: Rnase Y domain-containing protein, partial [Clostridia bacterium]